MRLLLILAPVALASAAHADTTAIYANPGAVCSMMVRIASNGDVRGEAKGDAPNIVPGRAFYIVAGKEYLVDQTDSGSVVMRLEDVEKVVAEQAGKLGFYSLGSARLTLVRNGTVSINKWSGDAYYLQSLNGQLSSRPLVVISHDRSLAQLGRVMERQFATSEMMMKEATNGRAPRSNMDQVLSSGAPISFADAELQTISFKAIPKKEFSLPGQPVPLDEVRRIIGATAKGVSVELPKGQKPEVPCHIMIGG